MISEGIRVIRANSRLCIFIIYQISAENPNWSHTYPTLPVTVTQNRNARMRDEEGNPCFDSVTDSIKNIAHTAVRKAQRRINAKHRAKSTTARSFTSQSD